MEKFLIEASIVLLVIGWISIIVDATLVQLREDENAKPNTNEEVSGEGEESPTPATNPE